MIQTLGSDRSHPSLRDGVSPGRSERGADRCDAQVADPAMEGRHATNKKPLLPPSTNALTAKWPAETFGHLGQFCSGIAVSRQHLTGQSPRNRGLSRLSLWHFGKSRSRWWSGQDSNLRQSFCSAANFRQFLDILASEKPAANAVFRLDFPSQQSGTVSSRKDGLPPWPVPPRRSDIRG